MTWPLVSHCRVNTKNIENDTARYCMVKMVRTAVYNDAGDTAAALCTSFQLLRSASHRSMNLHAYTNSSFYSLTSQGLS